MTKARRVAEIAQEVSARLQIFRPRGAGAGNYSTNDAMREINSQVVKEFGGEVVEVGLSGLSKQSVDFYFEDERTVVEIEFSLSNPYPCLEKDAFKVLVAKSAGKTAERLVLIGDPGCTKRLSAAAPQAVIGWLRSHQKLEVEIIELAG